MKHILLITLIFTLCNCKENKQIATIVSYQKMYPYNVGWDAKAETLRTYKAMYLTDSICFEFNTHSSFNIGDKIEYKRD